MSKDYWKDYRSNLPGKIIFFCEDGKQCQILSVSYTVDLQWLEHGFELVFESLGKNPIVADLE